MRTLVSKRGADKIKFLLDISKPKIKIGRNTEGRGNFFDIKVPENDVGQKFEMEYDIDAVKSLGIEVRDRSIDVKIDEESIHKINTLLERGGVLKEDILIGIHPGGMPSHRWPIENFSKIIEQISKSISCKFVVTGVDDEISLAERLKKITRGEIINLAGQINLNELCALIKRCALYISNDTGPMHIAAVLQTPLIAIFGPGHTETPLPSTFPRNPHRSQCDSKRRKARTSPLLAALLRKARRAGLWPVSDPGCRSLP